jgi:hypothetical protein
MVPRTSNPMRIANCLLALQVTRPSVNAILIPVGLVFAIVSIARRHRALGGWLLYFYFWFTALVVVRFLQVIQHFPRYLDVKHLGPELHLALLIATFPRLLACSVTVVVAYLLLRYWDWAWVDKLRLSLVVTAVIACLSLILDMRYFPTVLLSNVMQWVGIVLWTLYFYGSERVERVFRTRDWETATQFQITTDS